MTRTEWLASVEKGHQVVVLERAGEDGVVGVVEHRSALIITVEVESTAGKRTIEYRTSDGLAILLGGITHPAARIDPYRLLWKVKKELYLEVRFPWKELAHFYVLRGPEHSQSMSGPYLLDEEVEFSGVLPIPRQDWIKGHTEGKPIERMLKSNLELRQTLESAKREKVEVYVRAQRQEQVTREEWLRDLREGAEVSIPYEKKDHPLKARTGRVVKVNQRAIIVELTTPTAGVLRGEMRFSRKDGRRFGMPGERLEMPIKTKSEKENA